MALSFMAHGATLNHCYVLVPFGTHRQQYEQSKHYRLPHETA